MPHIMITCLNCQQVNQIFAEGVPGFERVACSNCQQDLGRFGDLEKADEDHEPREKPAAE